VPFLTYRIGDVKLISQQKYSLEKLRSTNTVQRTSALTSFVVTRLSGSGQSLNFFYQDNSELVLTCALQAEKKTSSKEQAQEKSYHSKFK
jgi:hypothetical protein